MERELDGQAGRKQRVWGVWVASWSAGDLSGDWRVFGKTPLPPQAFRDARSSRKGDYSLHLEPKRVEEGGKRQGGRGAIKHQAGVGRKTGNVQQKRREEKKKNRGR